MDSIHICLKSVFADTWLGGVIYIQNLVRAMASLPEEERTSVKLSLVVRPAGRPAAEVVLPYLDNLYVDSLWKLAWFEAIKRLASVAAMPRGVFNPRNYDFVYPEIAGDRALYAWGGWIPDFQFLHLPHMFTARQVQTFESVYKRVARNAPVVVLSSKMAQEDLEQFYPEAIPRSVVMNFVSYMEPRWFDPDPEQVQKKYGLPERFFLVSNQFWRHKDHNTLVNALSVLKERKNEMVVACTGSVDKNDAGYFHEIMSRITSLGLDESIRVLGFVPRVDQIQLMRRSLAVIQPSLFEGWSTVVEDARSLGKPVLLSDFPVHLEQNPPGSHFFERGNHEQLASLMESVSDILNPGPDSEVEALVRPANRERLLAYGRRFLDIARMVTG